MLFFACRYAARRPNVEFTTIYYMPEQGPPVPLLIGQSKGKVLKNEELRWQYDESLRFWFSVRDNTKQYNYWVQRQRETKALEQRMGQLAAYQQVREARMGFRGRMSCFSNTFQMLSL